MIKTYDVIKNTSLEGLVADVNRAIRNGMQPVGGVVIAPDGGYVFYCQTIVEFEIVAVSPLA